MIEKRQVFAIFIFSVLFILTRFHDIIWQMDNNSLILFFTYEQRDDPNSSDGSFGPTDGRAELEWVANCVPTVDGDESQGQDRDGYRDSLLKYEFQNEFQHPCLYLENDSTQSNPSPSAF